MMLLAILLVGVVVAILIWVALTPPQPRAPFSERR
jgi:hypothetical protein